MNRQEFLEKILQKKKIDKEIYNLLEKLEDFDIARQILNKIDGSVHLDAFLNSTNQGTAITEKNELYRKNIALIRDSLLKSESKKFLEELLDLKILFLRRENIKKSKVQNKTRKEKESKFNENTKSNNKAAVNYRELGLEKYNLGEFKEAIKNFDKALELEPTNANNLYFRGAAKNSLGEYKDAINDYDLAIHLDSTEADFFNNRSVAKANLGLFEEALKDSDIALKLDPSNANYLYVRGVSKSVLGQYKDAINDYDLAIKLDSTKADYFSVRGIARVNLGLFSEALKDSDFACKLEPNNETIIENRNVVLNSINYGELGLEKYNLGEFEEAIKNFDKALELEPTNANNLYLRGAAKDSLGEYKDAINDYDLAIHLDSTEAWFFNNRSVAKSNLGLFEEALKDSDIALKLDPNNETMIGNRNFYLNSIEGKLKQDMPSRTAMLTNPDEHFGPKVGLILKTFNPALGGTEALERYRQGDRSGAVISAIQAVGGPIGLAAGLINASTRNKGINSMSLNASTRNKGINRMSLNKFGRIMFYAFLCFVFPPLIIIFVVWFFMGYLKNNKAKKSN